MTVKIIEQGFLRAYWKGDLYRIYDTETETLLCNLYPSGSVIIFVNPIPIQIDDLTDLISFCKHISQLNKT